MYSMKGAMMLNRFRTTATAGLGLALACLALAPMASAQPGLNAPPVPVNLEVPDGNILVLKGHAKGTQNYICLPTASGYAWTFFSPQATLFLNFKFFGGEFQQQIITHFLSPNPK